MLIKTKIGLTCPTGWTRHNGKCYEFFVNGEYRRSWKDAVHFCSEIGAQILEIKSEEEQAYISLHNARLAKGRRWKNFKISSRKFEKLKFCDLSKAGVQDFWIGAWNGPGGSGWLQWSDGSSVQYDQLPLDQERYHQNNQNNLGSF